MVDQMFCYQCEQTAGGKGMYLGPSLPAFLSPNVLQFLVDNFGIKPMSTPDEDLKQILR